MKRLRQDFRSLISTYSDDEIQSQKVSKFAKRDTDLRDTSINYGMFIEDNVMS